MIKQKTKEQKLSTEQLKKLKEKAAIFDELVGFIEDKGLGLLMKEVEKEENVHVSQARKIF